MSRFFKNLKEEANEIKAKTESITEEPKTAPTKHEKRLSELSKKVTELKNSKSFEKSAKKFVSDLKKYTPLFKATGIPSFIEELAKDARFRAIKSISSEMDGYLEQFRVKEETRIESNRQFSKKEKKEADLTAILSIKSERERKAALKQLNIMNLSDSEAFAVTVSLFTIAKKEKDPVEMIRVLKECLNREENDEKLFNNMNNFLESTSTFIEKESELVESYMELLEKLKEKGWKNGEFKKKEFQFLVLGEFEETTVEPFNILYLLRSGKWSEAREVFERDGKRMEEENTRVSFDGKEEFTKAWGETLKEYGNYAVKEKEFEEAFKAVSSCWTHGIRMKTLAYGLCVVLLQSVADSSVFADFIEDFKGFDGNSMLLESCEVVDEIFRAFYLVHKKDGEGAARILEEKVGINAYRELSEISLSL